jgi:hypothetical protein
MKTYRMSFADSLAHKPEHPERTAKRTCAWDVEFKVWPNRASLLKTIEMQENTRFTFKNWILCQKEGAL